MTNPTPSLLPQPPMPWLLPAWQKIAAASQRGSLAQGLLVTGLDGIGVLEFARALGQFLLCDAPVDSASCGVCRSCQLLVAGNHPDIYVLKPEEDSAVIRVQQIRTLSEFMANTAQQGGRKVIIVEPADAMNSNAANALLKNLEEPIGETFFVLASSHPSRLLATIKSRCSRVVLTPPTKAQALEWLASHQVKDAELSLAQANGAPLRVLEWLTSRYLESSLTLADHLVKLIEGKTSATAASKSLAALGVPLVLERLIFWVQQAMSRQWLPNRPRTSALEQLLSERSPQAVHLFYESLLRKRALQLSGNNLNAGLVVDETLIELAALFKG